MDGIINLYKEVGETPLARLTRYLERERGVSTSDSPDPDAYTYLGRLDPMAEGVLLVAPGTIGNDAREEVLALPKTYHAEILLGFSTDTYDILGKLVDEADERVLKSVNMLSIVSALASFVGRRTQPYPPYSSKPVDGKPLFQWAREGRLDSIEIPAREIEVMRCDLAGFTFAPRDEVSEHIVSSIGRVDGDFRQSEILATWERALSRRFRESFPVVAAQLTVSSGTYIRAIADELGRALGVPSCLLSLIRMSVGKYTIENALRSPLDAQSA